MVIMFFIVKAWLWDVTTTIGKFFTCLAPIGNDLIKPSKEVKNLGVWLDPSLTMNTHINKTCSIAFYQLYNLRRIRKYLSQDSVEILIHTLIYSRIGYCNSLYLGLPDYQIQKIQRVQNAAARLVYNAGKCCHITPLLFKLHWLPIRELFYLRFF